jgi:hypothetical protein
VGVMGYIGFIGYDFKGYFEKQVLNLKAGTTQITIA